ncbi:MULTISPECIES: Ppx/GppA phosphatase family protein [Gordonia]|uniref:Exopolyphosphatase n=1 Tax=Gordonia alkanivorans CGMCC 6845 TaxID=1423140 RepID=W9DMD2_9ACTN|nr:MULTISPECIES: Ppx/GppA phosphatase family protein [Gordonia]ETA08615.1 exopolyphosphatase [Gordonia alkanivorans CGMCC 6845]MDH3005277.1 Ppx/GppA phosphatase family protein [Gordonia alkanivorans]MDH3014689.1 Ppx/GppA phosphatase family protein [Gordonia alkanivorans]MDH3019219.1 Ppx/GppA phosphatase family protein [Gordonia alkanivorans]MDH3022911.1 Ppx/GppA phosphatase family protein [Gordonia alkanivorans]
MTVVGAVDCGTNSIRLLVARAGDDGRLVDLHREMRVVRLGYGVDATGQFAPESIERTRIALADYVKTMESLGVVKVRMVATSATRDASNRDEFFAMTADLLGCVSDGAIAEVISGDEEARLSFRGAVGELDPATGPFVVTDLGGGSTEVVLGDTDGVHAAYSADIGCVRLTERTLPSDPPTAEEIAAARAFAAERLAEAFSRVPVEPARTWVGVAGTMTTLAALGAGLTEYDSEKIHLSRISLADLDRVCWDLVHMTRADRAALGPMHPGRVDVIGGGSLVTLELARVLAERAGITELVVSEHDILDGIALGILD